jgi:hypothetical protein
VSIEKIKIEGQEELQQLITKDLSIVEKDLTLICNNVPINDKTTLDVLCHDNNGQLVIVQMSIAEDDIMLLHGIQSMDYIDKFKSFLKATYNKHKIDDKEKARLILIAPSFSDALRSAVESMKGMRVDLYEWEYLKLGDHKGLRLQPIFASTPTEKSFEEPKEEKSEDKKHGSKHPKKKESTSEPESKEVEPELPKPEESEPSKTEEWQPPAEEPVKEEPTVEPEPEHTPKKKLRLF